jgi:hypothetical protein
MAVYFRVGAQINGYLWLGVKLLYSGVSPSRDRRDRDLLLPSARSNPSDCSADLVRTRSRDIAFLATHYIHQLGRSLIVAFLALPDWPLR